MTTILGKPATAEQEHRLQEAAARRHTFPRIQFSAGGLHLHCVACNAKIDCRYIFCTSCWQEVLREAVPELVNV